VIRGCRESVGVRSSKEGNMKIKDIVRGAHTHRGPNRTDGLGLVVTAAVVCLVMLASVSSASAQVQVVVAGGRAVAKAMAVDTVQNACVGGVAVGISGACGGYDVAKDVARNLIDYHNIPVFGDVASICEFVWGFGGMVYDQEKANQCQEQYLRRLAQRQQELDSTPEDQKEQNRREICVGLIETMVSRIKELVDANDLTTLDRTCDYWSATLRENNCRSEDASGSELPPSLAEASAEVRQAFMKLKRNLVRNCFQFNCEPGMNNLRCAQAASSDTP